MNPLYNRLLLFSLMMMAVYLSGEKNRIRVFIIFIVKPESGESSVRVLSKRWANTVESHAYLTIAMGREKDAYRIGLAIKGCGIFLPDITNWAVSWKKADVKDDMFGSEEYKRYLTGTTLDTLYEKLSGEGGNES